MNGSGQDAGPNNHAVRLGCWRTGYIASHRSRRAIEKRSGRVGCSVEGSRKGKSSGGSGIAAAGGAAELACPAFTEPGQLDVRGRSGEGHVSSVDRGIN